jgi:outer membrane lipoprotein SlyB
MTQHSSAGKSPMMVSRHANDVTFCAIYSVSLLKLMNMTLSYTPLEICFIALMYFVRIKQFLKRSVQTIGLSSVPQWGFIPFFLLEAFMIKSSSINKPVAGLVLGLVLGGFGAAAMAQTSAPVAAMSPAAAKVRYEADKKLCADEASAEARLQCRRDAQSIYSKSLADAKGAALPAKPTTSQASAAVCATCGHVSAVSVVEKKGDSNAAGLIAGGVAGAVLGHQVGGGFGKDLATVAGAAGGAYAGKKIQENMNASKVWRVSVKYTDGHSANFDFAQDPGLAVGDAVKNSGKTVVKN